jgi:hypothetical protein
MDKTVKKCKNCGEKKSKTEFYSTSRFICKECKKKSDDNAKTNKNAIISVLTEIYAAQKDRISAY